MAHSASIKAATAPSSGQCPAVGVPNRPRFTMSAPPQDLGDPADLFPESDAPRRPGRWASRFQAVVDEIGLQSLLRAHRDVKILFVQRIARLFAYGQATLILTLYFTALGFTDEQIGFFMTATLFGDVIISFFLTLFADALGRRRVLMLGATLMFISGVVFATCDNFWILLLAAIAGVISPSGNEVGPFRAVEESTLAHLTPTDMRSDIYSWYALMGRVGSALGTITSGNLTQALQVYLGWTNVRAYRIVYLFYSAVALFKLWTSFSLSEACELGIDHPKVAAKARSAEGDRLLDAPDADDIALDDAPAAPRDAVAAEEGPAAPAKQPGRLNLKKYLPPLSAHSYKTLSVLLPLFFIDALGSGLTNFSWMTFYFTEKFHIREASLGFLFFSAHVLAALAALVAASNAKRFGLLRAMLIAHLPSSIILGLIPAVSNKALAMALLIIRTGTNMMDIAPRQALISSIVLPEERTSVMGFANVMRTFSTGIGPTITGYMAARGTMWISFELAFGLKVLYDIGFITFYLTFDMRRT
ncbi:major facilitator superfamily domain-containing protein [Dipodascopsis tothii]|uniref:major facilitator superfamily domain-containing protein n=1 Tax=Dipodascopsis tothii TaxID=44089 RepID=UPI0034CDFFD1